MPEGKPANRRCVQLDENNLCRLFGLPERPAVCVQFSAEPDACGKNADEAMQILLVWEQSTQ